VAALIARYWPDSNVHRFILEADSVGGTLAARWTQAHGLSWQPGLLDLASARRELSVPLLHEYAQPLEAQVSLIAAPPVPGPVRGAVERLVPRLAGRSDDGEAMCVVVDCGRFTPDNPAVAVARSAALTLLVGRPDLEQVQALAPAARELEAEGCTLGLVTVGHGPYPGNEVSAAVGVPLLGQVDEDRRAAAAFVRDGFAVHRGFDRTRLARQSKALAESVYGRCWPPPAANGARVSPITGEFPVVGGGVHE